mgnify:CR=1 FL=1
MDDSAQPFDREVDVLVLGTGGAGLTAALAAHDFGAGEVLVLEKYGMVGGTTAMSGGNLWVPLNHHMAEVGIEDSFDEVVTYLDGVADGDGYAHALGQPHARAELHTHRPQCHPAAHCLALLVRSATGQRHLHAKLRQFPRLRMAGAALDRTQAKC